MTNGLERHSEHSVLMPKGEQLFILLLSSVSEFQPKKGQAVKLTLVYSEMIFDLDFQDVDQFLNRTGAFL